MQIYVLQRLITPLSLLKSSLESGLNPLLNWSSNIPSKLNVFTQIIASLNHHRVLVTCFYFATQIRYYS